MKKPEIILVVMILPLIALMSACKHNRTEQGNDALLSHIDSAVKPGDDFFDYANGKWFSENPIPASEQSNGIWQLIEDTINHQIQKICESSAALKDAEKGSNKQKIGDFFFSGMDSVNLNKNGISDLKPDLARIDGVRDLKGLIQEAAYIHTVSSAPLFNFYVIQDDKNSSKYAIYIGQGGLSLPDRTYYLDQDGKAKEVREQYVKHLGNMFKIMGYDATQAGQTATRVMEMETSLAKASRKREDTRDPLLNYNKMDVKSLAKLTPDIDWTIFMQGVGLKNVDSVVVSQPEYLSALNGFLKKFSINDWKNYLKFQLVSGLATYMDDKTYMEHFSFYSTTLRGIKEPRPRWKRVVTQTDNSLGELIGQVYVDEYLPKGTKEKLQEIGKAIKEVFAERIKALDWMSDATKEKALRKLNTVIMKVGYPDKWKDLSSLNIDRSSYVKNVMRSNQWSFAYMINKYGKAVDRNEWDMQPQTYNAYYNPSNNEIVIPGCNIIVPGYEGKMADDALLYAIIGATFGHEITHGFDDQGCKYNEAGNLSNWWTKEDSSRFYAKTRMMVAQFNAYVAVDSLHINGELTLGENIADLGGVIMGYEAFKKTRQYKDQQIIAGMTPDQRYFLGYALAWMVNMRPEAITAQVKSNEHAPAKWRVIGPLSNMPEFYKAFNVKQGDKMWRADSLQIKIW
jgi:putative endopeptidase